jgi:glycosyltransferase involved in cell wall biosynthesis
MLVEFESAALLPLNSPVTLPRRVGWFLRNVDPDCADTRYRCFHFARALAPDFQSIYFTSLEEVSGVIRNLDAIIIVDRIDQSVVDLVGLSGAVPEAASPAPAEKSLLQPRQVLWFGDHGASYSTSGIFDLRPHLNALREVHQEIPLMLVVASDNEAVYQTLVHRCGFPHRFVHLSEASLQSALQTADVALLPAGEDEHSAVESSRRVLKALAANVPVITRKAPSLSEFEDALFFGRTVEALRQSLGPVRTREVPRRLAAARRVLARYTPEKLSVSWACLLRSAIGRSLNDRIAARTGKALILIQAQDSVAAVKRLLSAANAVRSLSYDLLVSTEFLEGNPEIRSVIRKSRQVPKFFSGALEHGENLLRGCSGLIVEQTSGPMAQYLLSIASQLGVPTLSSEQAAAGSLAYLRGRRKTKLPVKNANSAGPHREWVKEDGTVDWAFIVNRKGRGWILDAICREIGSRQPASWKVVYHPEPSPHARNVFFSHYALFNKHYVETHSSELTDQKIFVWYTHPREEDPVSVAKLLQTFEKATKIIFACESNRQIWINRGLAEDKTVVILGGADADLFTSHERGGGVVGLSSSFYERKNPDILLEVVKLLPHRKFVLLGRNWNQYANFEELRAQANFRYTSAPYRDYPAVYGSFDVFLSMSALEGGPIPLVEAMMSNAVPVASRTGFAPDLIRHGSNGFIFDLDATPAEIAELIESAFSLTGDVRATVERYDWNNFSAEIMKLAE